MLPTKNGMKKTRSRFSTATTASSSPVQNVNETRPASTLNESSAAKLKPVILV